MNAHYKTLEGRVKIAHFGDTHLGFRAYQAVTEKGVNVREHDVAMAFRQLVEGVLDWGVDVCILPGDVFDSPSPSMAVMTEAIRQFNRLQYEDIQLVFVGGNHDSPRRKGDGNPLQTLHAAIRGSGYAPVLILDEPDCVLLNLEGVNVSVVGLPHGTYSAERMLERADVAKAANTDVSILAVHAPIEVHGESRLLYARISDESIPAEILRPERWTYVAAGDFHEHLAFAKNACYSGSIENVTAGPWRNPPPKGWVGYDTKTKAMEFFELPTRPVYDYVVNCVHFTPDEIGDSMQKVTSDVPPGSMVRIILEGITREAMHGLDWGLVRGIKEQALHLQLKPVLPELADGPERAPYLQRKQLEEEVSEYVEHRFDPGPGTTQDQVRSFAEECLEGAK